MGPFNPLLRVPIPIHRKNRCSCGPRNSSPTNLDHNAAPASQPRRGYSHHISSSTRQSIYLTNQTLYLKIFDCTIMAAPAKAIVLRWPAAAALKSSSGFATTTCPRLSFSTANSAVCRAKQQVSISASLPRAFTRSNHSSASTKRAAHLTSISSKQPLATFRSRVASSRSFSSTSAPRNESTVAAAATASASNAPLDWNSFFQLRVKRRRIQLFFSVTMGIIGGAGGAIVLSAGLAEPLVAQIPLDPFITLGLLTMACAGTGWLVGPSIGSQIFYLLNRRYKGQMMQKEKEFFARVKKNRVDPTNSSAGNPGMSRYKISLVARF